MGKVKDETRYKRKLRTHYENAGHWSESYEPAMGSGTGYPDVQFLSPLKVLLPAELKVGEVIGDRVFPREVRGDQVVWARNFWRYGGISIMMIGVERVKDSNIWDTYATTGDKMMDWKLGYPIDDMLVEEGSTPQGIVNLVRHFLREAPF